jgi:hypothetical protein
MNISPVGGEDSGNFGGVNGDTVVVRVESADVVK